MKSFRKYVILLFGYDRSERRATYILSLIMVILLLVRLFAYRPGEPLKVSRSGEAESQVTPSAPVPVQPPALHTFDPNNASMEELLSLGLTRRQAGILVNYRNSGARFRKPEELLRVYGIDSATFGRLLPYISIEPVVREEEHSRAGTVVTVISRVADADSAKNILSTISYPDINVCTAADLLPLPGIGPVLSERIIRYRRLLGGFVSREQLGEVYGIDSSTLSRVIPLVQISYDSVRAVDLSAMSYGELARHPYIGRDKAILLLRYRELMGGGFTLAELVEQKVLTRDEAIRLAPYIRPPDNIPGDDYEFILSKVLK